MNKEDAKNLELLSIFHYVVAGFTAFFSCMFLIYIYMGLAVVSGQFMQDTKGVGPPPFFGWIFVIMGAVFLLLGWSIALCMVFAALNLKHRKNRIFCMVVAGIECIQMPFGTILGIFTLIALNKDSIKEMFAPQNPPQLPHDPQADPSMGEKKT